MALLRRLFFRKPPDGLLEISERVYVFNCCFTTDAWEEEDYKKYIGGIIGQLREHSPDSQFLVFNFREEETKSLMANVLSEFDITIMDYPRQYEGCPLLTMEVIHHFLRSTESWLSLGQHNVLMMHCERGGWPVLAFMLAALLIYRKQYSGEYKTLDMIYRQAPRELLQLLSPLNPVPSQLRYLQYVSRRNVVSEWPPLDRALTLDCVILRSIPNFGGQGGCRPIFRIYGQDPFVANDRSAKVLYSTLKRSKAVRTYKQAECELVKIDINCCIQGDVVLECISLNDDLEREEMMFRVVFNTAFIRSNILMLNLDEVDILWNAKELFPKEFRAEILFSEMDAAAAVVAADVSCFEEKGGLPVEAFAKVHEIFSHVDWLDHGSDFALNVLQHINATNLIQEMSDTESPPSAGICSLLQELSPRDHQDKKSQSELDNSPKTSPKDYRNMIINASNLIQETSDSGSPPSMIISSLLQELSPRGHQHKKTHVVDEDSTKSSLPSAVKTQSVLLPKMSPDTDESKANEEPQDPRNALQVCNQSVDNFQKTSKSSQTTSLSCNSVQVSSLSVSGHHDASLAPCHKPLLHDHALSVSAEVTHQIPASPAIPDPNLASSCKHEAAGLKSDSFSPTTPPPPPAPRPSIASSASKVPSPPPPPQLPPHHFSSSCPAHFPHTKESKSHMQDRDKPSSATPLPAPETSSSGTNSSTSLSTAPLPAPATAKSTFPPPPPPPPPPTPPLKTPVFNRNTDASFSTPSPPASTVTLSTTSSPPTPPPPPKPPLKEQSAIRAGPPPPPPPPLYSGSSASSTVSSPTIPLAPPPPSLSSNSSPVPPPPPIAKVVSKTGVASPVPAPPSISPSSGKGRLSRTISSRSHQTKKLKPLHWLKLTRAVQGSLWAEAQKSGEASKAPEIDMSELENLFSATIPNSEKGGKPNQRVPRGPQSDKVQLRSVLALEDSAIDADQVENLIKFCPTKEEMDLIKGYTGDKEKLGKCEQFFLELMKVPRVESKLRVFSFKIQFHTQVRNSAKLRRIMQTILSLGNALNQGTARGAAIGFRLDSLLKLTDTRARNNKMTLMHYLCKVLADKLPELLDFSEDLTSLEPASKIQLKFLAEEMQALSKGLEKVVQELSMSENDGAISENFSKILREFLRFAEAEVRTLASLYSAVGRNVDALILYFGEDPARCPFEQVISTLLNFVRMFNKAHNENCKQLEQEMKKMAESEKSKMAPNESERLLHTPIQSGNVK
ncbi:Formin-like protein 13 [Citrus sinensis]|uniref:Formin-like protein 13 n=1 Tax=Citrus sinensis TaxID=2711 RepID=A0ACB8IVD6_CITSI|nr:Formin-like protein 13 [Citrus sinensis]